MMNTKKESYERTELKITEFAQEDVIVTSGNIITKLKRLITERSVGQDNGLTVL